MSDDTQNRKGAFYRFIQATIIISVLIWFPFQFIGIKDDMDSTFIAAIVSTAIPICILFFSMMFLHLSQYGFDYKLCLMQLVAVICFGAPAVIFSVQGFGADQARQTHLKEYINKADSDLSKALQKRDQGRQAVMKFKNDVERKANLEAKGINVGVVGKGPIYHSLIDLSELATLVLTELDSEKARQAHVAEAKKIILEMEKINNNPSHSYGGKTNLLTSQREKMTPLLRKLNMASVALNYLKIAETFSRFGIRDKSETMARFRESINLADSWQYELAPGLIRMTAYKAVCKYWRSILWVWVGMIALVLWPLIANLVFALTRPKNIPKPRGRKFFFVPVNSSSQWKN